MTFRPLPFLLVAALAHAQDSLPSSRLSPLRDARLPQAVASFGAARLGEWIYVYGGHTGRMHDHARDTATGRFVRLRVQPAFALEELTPGPALQGLALVAHEGRVYRIGGMAAKNQSGETRDLHSTAECAAFNVRTGTWSNLPPLPEPRSSHDAVVLDAAIYVVGGWTLAGEATTWSKKAWRMRLDREVLAWEPLADAPFERRGGAAVAFRGRVLFLGGLDRDVQRSSSIDAYDPRSGAWSKGGTLAGDGFGLAAVAVGEALLTSGSDGVLRSCDGASFRELGSALVPRFFHRMLEDGSGHVVLIGGETRHGHTATLELLRAAPGAAAPVHAWTVDLPTKGRNRQGLVVHDDRILLAGGNRSIEQHPFEREDFASDACSVSLATLEASKLADFPVARQSLADLFGAEGSAALLLGGFGFDATVPRSQTEVYRLVGDESRWVRAAGELASPRTQFGACEHEGRILVFGGMDFDPRRNPQSPFAFPLAVEELGRDGARVGEPRGWQLPRARRAFAGAKLGGSYYLVGGSATEMVPVLECDVVDLATGKWRTIPPPSVHRLNGQLVAVRDMLFLVGGTSQRAGQSAPDPVIERYDPAREGWSVLGDVGLRPVPHLRAFAFRDRLVVFTQIPGAAVRSDVAVVPPEILFERVPGPGSGPESRASR